MLDIKGIMSFQKNIVNMKHKRHNLNHKHTFSSVIYHGNEEKICNMFVMLLFILKRYKIYFKNIL